MKLPSALFLVGRWKGDRGKESRGFGYLSCYLPGATMVAPGVWGRGKKTEVSRLKALVGAKEKTSSNNTDIETDFFR